MEITPGTCPYCQVVNRASETIVGRDGGPQEGDIMLCENCAKISIYLSHGATRKPDEYELAELLAMPEVAIAVFAAQLDLQ